MSEVSKEYNFRQVEEKWVQSWDSSIYYFDWESKKPQYIIDTPPPYPTGNFHIGNALNWCYIDFVARYKRMQGYNVMFPQGWDCHGLPTEVKVEELNHITKNQVPREEFRRLCEKLTDEAIVRFHQSMGRLGLSIDWSNEYVTMKPEYYVKTQTSFVRMYEKGQIYREEHPGQLVPSLRYGHSPCRGGIRFPHLNSELHAFSSRRRPYRDRHLPARAPARLRGRSCESRR